jgi:glycosyltransferase involved in cell wall biosynthesis
MKKYIVSITGPSTAGKNVLAETFLSDGYNQDEIFPIPLISSREIRKDDDIRFISCCSDKEFAESSFFIRNGKYGILYSDMIEFIKSKATLGVMIIGAIEMKKIDRGIEVFNTREGVEIELYKTLLLFSRDFNQNYVFISTRMPLFFNGSEIESRIKINNSLLREFFLREDFLDKMNRTFYLEDRQLPEKIANNILQDLSLSYLAIDCHQIEQDSLKILIKRKNSMKNVYYSSYGYNFKAFITSASNVLFDENSLSEIEQSYIKNNPNETLEIVQDISQLPESFLLSVDAFDDKTCKFIKSCMDFGKEIYFEQRKLEDSDLVKLQKAHDKVNRKDFFYDIAHRLLPEGMLDQNFILFSSYQEMLQEITIFIEQNGYPIIIKSANGKEGRNCLVCRDDKDLEIAKKIISDNVFLENSGHNEDSIIVEKFLEKSSSYNISFFIGDLGIEVEEDILISKKIINHDTIYCGIESHDLNSESLSIITDFTKKVSKEFHDINFRGWIEIDFIWDDNYKIKLIKSNPKAYKNTHALKHIKKLGQAYFMMPILDWIGEEKFDPAIIDKILNEKIANAFPYDLNRDNSISYMFYSNTSEEIEIAIQSLLDSGMMCIKSQSSYDLISKVTPPKKLNGNYAYFYQLIDQKKLSIENESNKSMEYIVVSTEDDKYRVAGGIGTYLGILTKEIAGKGIKTTWITQSPDTTEFNENSDGVTRIYLSRYSDDSGYMNIAKFSEKIGKFVKSKVDFLLTNSKTKIIIESPEWEGLLASYYRISNDPRVIKISRTHTPLIHTKIFNDIPENEEVKIQMDMEYVQLRFSNIISSPTDYMLKLINFYFPELSHPNIKQSQAQVVIPNCINMEDFVGHKYFNRDSAIKRFNELTGLEVLSENKNIFVLGSVEKRKGVDDILNAFNIVAELEPKTHLYFIGHFNKDGKNLTENPKYQISDVMKKVNISIKDRVHLVGYIDHSLLNEVIKAGDLYLFAYLADNFPGSLIEIALSETPNNCN